MQNECSSCCCSGSASFVMVYVCGHVCVVHVCVVHVCVCVCMCVCV